MAAGPALDDLVPEYLRLSTPNVSDALDRLGIKSAPHGILPLWPGCKKIAGPAATMKLVDVGKGLKSPSPAMGSLEAVKAAQPGDVLVRLDATGLQGFSDLRALLDRHRPGDTLQLVYLRDGLDRATAITLGTRP